MYIEIFNLLNYLILINRNDYLIKKKYEVAN